MSVISGKLFTWIDHTRLLHLLITSRVLDHRGGLNDMLRDIRRMVSSARTEGCNWVYTVDEIEPSTEKPSQFKYQLPSADLANYLGVENNNHLKAYFKKHKLSTRGISWDTEAGAIYPRFTDNKAARAFIAATDRLFDLRWLAIQQILAKDGLG